MIHIIWSFRVRPGKEREFESAYRGDGDWAQLFSKAKGYGGTTLLREPKLGSYVTIDRWDDQSSFDRFKQEFHDTYYALDARFEGFTESEEHVGTYEVIE